MSAFVALFGMPGGPELLIVLFIALMLFGKRLPEVARNMGKGLTEFKKGIRGVEEDVQGAASYDPGPTAERPMADDDLENVSAPKFTPPAAANETDGDAPTDSESSTDYRETLDEMTDSVDAENDDATGTAADS